MKSVIIHYDDSVYHRKLNLPVRSDGKKYTWNELVVLGIASVEQR